METDLYLDHDEYRKHGMGKVQMENIPEPEGVVGRKWSNCLQWLMTIAVLALLVIHYIRPDVISQTLFWIITVPLALCMCVSFCRMREQAKPQQDIQDNRQASELA